MNKIEYSMHSLVSGVKINKRAIMLVLASNENQTVKNARKIWKKYMYKDSNIKVFFVYGELSSELEEYDASSDLIFQNIKESYPMNIDKTLEAMKFIHSNYTYDFFIRTNISTFWDFEKLHLHLSELPLSMCYSGDGPLGRRSDGGWGYSETGHYLSGVDTIVSYDMIDSLVNNIQLVNRDVVEDSAMGLYFNGVLGASMLPNRICFFEDITDVNEDAKSLVEQRIIDAIKNNKDHYRVKSNINREQIDLFIYNILYEQIYGKKQKMILLMSTYVRPVSTDRHSRFDILKYSVSSFKTLPFKELYFFILLDGEYEKYYSELKNFIFTTFSHMDPSKINIVFDRYIRQDQWAPFISELMTKYGSNQPVWFTQNDDHPFVDFDTKIIEEGLELMKSCDNPRRSIYITHWPEIIKLSLRNQTQQLIGNYIKFNLSLLDSCQIFNLGYLYFVFVEYKWKQNHNRIDSVLNELVERPSFDDTLHQTIFVPLRETVRHFDGYHHAGIWDDCPELNLPANDFKYDKETIITKMTAKHSSAWTFGNDFNIPQEWIDISLNLHKGKIIHTL